MCENNVNVGFGLVLSAKTTAEVLNKIDDLIVQLLKAMGLSTEQTDYITIVSIKLNSVAVDGTADPTGGTSSSSTAASAATLSLLSAISGGA